MQISLWLGGMLFVIYALKNGTSIAGILRNRYDESHFSLDLLFRSPFDYNRWKTSEIVLGIFGLFIIIISMLFNGYSFYFVTLYNYHSLFMQVNVCARLNCIICKSP